MALINEKKEVMLIQYKKLGKDALSMNHYELADQTSEHDPEVWKQFLIDPEISAWIRTERVIIQETELSKIVNNAANSRSTGQAQIVSALGKLNEGSTTKDGPVFIYCHVPLNDQEIHAPNAQTVAPLSDDIIGGNF